MQKKDILLHGVYMVRHQGQETRAIVEQIREVETNVGRLDGSSKRTLTRWICTKVSTNRTITIKSAGRFLRIAPPREGAQ